MNRRKVLALIGLGTASAAGLIGLDERRSSDLRSAASGPVSAGPPSGPRGGKTLVVYYSKTGKNFPDLDLEVGNTARVAEFIRARVGGDLFEIEPAVPYPADYDETDRMARDEERQHTYRAIKPGAPDTDQYGTIFLGYPIWWGEQPMTVQTFMRDHNLNGAAIAPFVTHGSSRFGNSLDVLSQYYPQAKILDGFERRGEDVYHDLDGTRGAVNSWLDGLGF